MSFESLGLSTELLRALKEQGYTEPTPVQAAAIPHVLQGKDLLAGAQTGTGKTAGFTLPLLQRLMQSANESKKGRIRALILVPTRELAAQVQASVVNYSRHLPISSTTVFGGVSIRGQINRLRRGVDVLVATPGRLLDHVSQKTIDLGSVEILVLDEADRMLDMGFIRDIRRILGLLPKTRQNLLFSATFSAEIKKLSDSFLNSPVLVEIDRSGVAAEKVNQVVHVVEQGRKRELLSYLIGSNNWQQVLVFTRTKHGANRLCTQLNKDGLKAVAIHGNKSQGARTRALAEFKDGKVRVLVATDIAARGLDIRELPHVVNYELPSVPEDYVHRIGRTGRAGRGGEAISLVSAEESRSLRDIEKLLGRTVPQRQVENFETNENLIRLDSRRPGKRASSGNRQGSRNGGQRSFAPKSRGNQRRGLGARRAS